jgi:hypothetical protein
MKPLAVDLCCGLGGWAEGLLAEGYDVVGFDVERHEYGCAKYPAQLVIQDIRTLHGAQFRDAALIVASPPCQEFSFMSMPWSRAKAIRAEYLSGEREVAKLTALFDACFRIQREACEAARRHIPMVVENVRGAIPWVGQSAAKYGSFHLWGDVPALMPIARRARLAGDFAMAAPGDDGVEGFTPHGQPLGANELGRHGSKSLARKRASAMVAKIPLPLSRYIASVYRSHDRRP